MLEMSFIARFFNPACEIKYFRFLLLNTVDDSARTVTFILTYSNVLVISQGPDSPTNESAEIMAEHVLDCSER